MEFLFQTKLRERYLKLEAESGKTNALFETLRQAIREGTIPAGARLPSTRTLSGWFGLSRGSVNLAYEMLAAEGLVRARERSGNYAVYEPANVPGPKKGRSATIPVLSTWASRLLAVPVRADKGTDVPGVLNLEPGAVDAALFPTESWKRVIYEEIRQFANRQHEDSYMPEGHLPLREMIARHLQRERGISVDPSLVMITNGSMQAIALLAMLLIREGDPVVMENPSYIGILRAVLAAGGQPIPARMDREGIVPDAWDARLLFVTPSRQFPTGAVLSPDRRKRLIEWAAARQAVIIEDDYDSEFRWGGRPVAPLKMLDQEDRVVYLGSFSKTMLTDLRIGYAVVPKMLSEAFRRAKYWIEPHPVAIVEQRALARFMAEGSYARHLRKMQRICGRKLAQFQNRLKEVAGEVLDLYPSEAGLQLFGLWRGDPAKYEQWKQAALQAGVKWGDAAPYYWHGERPASALFGFAHLSEDELAEAARRMGIALSHIGINAHS
jgi:GntR family transcriptional regulator/MocR family aminotransferase